VDDDLDRHGTAVAVRKTGIGYQWANGFIISQVIVGAAGDDNVGRFSFSQLFHDIRSQETGPAGDDDSFVPPEIVVICVHG
jgi:hypothetical protein